MIQPALTPAEFRGEGMDSPSILGELPYIADAPNDLAKIIAKANHLLPDDDPRKIAHKQVGVLLGIIAVRDELDRQGMGGHTYNLTIPNTLLDIIATLADALESYLPPSTPTTQPEEPCR